MKKRFIAYLLSTVLLLTSVAAPVFAKNLMSKSDSGNAAIVDLTSYLPPPPAPDSEENKAELKELEDYQNARTTEQEAYAQADDQKNVFRFANVIGDKFIAENLPLTAALFDRALKVAKETVAPAKIFFDRSRPFINDKNLKPCLPLDMDLSYPSGHATAGMMMAVLLARMVPEKQTEILKRGWDYARNREVGGVHYRSDIEAGRTSGTLIAVLLMKDKDFMKDFAAAKTELRTTLGY